ncbi:MAG: hypothetical protein ACXVP5_07900, partial [Tumebacillaceae bacterium]
MWKKTFRFLFWAVLLLTTYAYGKFQGGYAAWFMFYVSLLLCAYETLTARLAMKHPYSERKLSTNKLTAGQSLDVQIMLEVEGKWPHPWVMIEDSLPTRLLLQSGSSRELHFPGFNRKMQLS